MRKNLFFIHLDSLSNSLFCQYSAELPTVWRLKNEGMYFTSCYAAGASTIFAPNGASWGTVAGLDGFPGYDEADNRPRVNGPGLFEILAQYHGYYTMTVSFYHAQDGALAFYRNNVPGCHRYLHYQDPVPHDNSLREAFLEAGERPIAAYCGVTFDLVHDLMKVAMMESRDDPAGVQREIMGRCDQAVANIFACLDEFGRRDDTISILFGDHGICFYSREFNNSEDQAGIYVEAERSWVPLIVHNSNLGAGMTADVASLDDLRATGWGLLFPDEPLPDNGMIHAGVDLSRTKREFAFTQNKYALQNERARFSETSKAYAITDGKYRLTVSTPDPARGTGGLELYIDQSDPCNLADLMELFVLDEGGAVVDYDPGFLCRVDGLYFFSIFNPSALLWLGKRIDEMRDRLRVYVREKEEAAIKTPGAHPYRFAEEAFSISASMLRKRNKFGAERAHGKGMRWLAGLGRPLILFGAGDFGRKTLPMLRHFGVEVLAFVDNNSSLWGQNIDGINVYSPAKAPTCGNALVIGCLRNANTNAEAATQCRELGMEYLSWAGDVFGLMLGQPGFTSDQTK